jgi:endonuclease-8
VPEGDALHRVATRLRPALEGRTLARFEAPASPATGSWHLYRVGERWRKRAHRARDVVGADEWVAVCSSAPVVWTYPTVSSGASPVDHLGPHCQARA